ncbi:hypothetical protein MFIFM68171_05320 [Madurella fahalii]|uniref:Peptidase C45 hydrolase domain-containing protein n=1 Tax=Madurella fahalii TaxID=1157608 RepID=A0ABQ0GBI1_9PEZI
MSGWGSLGDPIRISEVNFHVRRESYRGAVLDGDPFNRGYTYGKLFRETIKLNVQHTQLFGGLPPRRVCEFLVREVYLPGIKAHWRKGLLELTGMAAGSGIPLVDLVTLNVKDELATLRRLIVLKHGADSAAGAEGTRVVDETISAYFPPATTGNDAITAHSWNAPLPLCSGNCLVCLEIHHEPHERLPVIFMVTQAGLIGGNGMNSHGLVVTANRLSSVADFYPQAGNYYLPSICLQRHLLGCMSTDGAYALCQSYARHISKNYIVSDRHGCTVSLELGPGEGPEHIFVHRGQLDDRAVLHTNHFQSFEAFAARRKVQEQCWDGSSYSKLSRLRSLVTETKGRKLGVLDIMAIFSDHEGSPNGMCQHTMVSGTVLFVVFNSTRRTISVCRGPPCANRMMHYTFDDDNDGMQGPAPEAEPDSSEEETDSSEEEPGASEAEPGASGVLRGRLTVRNL